MRPLLRGPVRHPEIDGHGAFPSTDSFVVRNDPGEGTYLSKLDNSTLLPVIGCRLVQSATIRQGRVRADLSQKLTPVTLGWHVYGVSRERVSDIKGFRRGRSFLAAAKCAECQETMRFGYEAAASSVGAPMMLRNLTSSRDSSRETCI